MTVRLPNFIAQQLDNKKLAAVLTPALLAKAPEDQKLAKAAKVGTAWIHWGDVHGHAVSSVD